MPIDYAGRVVFADGAPASGVQVRVFDRDDPAKVDDDLTVNTGVADAAGNFVVRFEPARWQDSITQAITYWEPRNPPWDLTPVQRTRDVTGPDLGDAFLPYLQFRHASNGTTRNENANLLPIPSQYTLSFAPPRPAFVPTTDGFNFVNAFPGYALPISVPGLPGLPGVAASYGLCGGMSSAAADFYMARRAIPATTTVPAQGSPLQQYIYRRQIDTFGAAGEYIARFAEWMMLPEQTEFGTWARTLTECGRLQGTLNNRMLGVLGLVYVDGSQPIWNNHQVLAFAWAPRGNGIRINIYDPNFPNRDDVVIDADLVTVGQRLRWRSPGFGLPPVPIVEPVMGHSCTQRGGGVADRHVRGFFVMPYQPVVPPAGL